MLLNDSVFGWITSCPWELIIFDESQYLKNAEAQRTQRCLAPGGVADRANKILLMSGTPIPNAAHEFHSTLSTVAPDVTGGMSSYQFSNRYTTGVQGEYGWQVTGGRNAEELGWRLRGSGFMVRRKKRSVLPQLPPERHQLIIFPQNQGTAAVIKKEQDNIPFTAQEILDAGKPLGYGAIPELRHEMGLEKMPDCISWVKDQLDGGLEKIVLFGYHQDVLEGMYKGLEKYKPLLVYGPTPMTQRQAAVDAFQHDEAYRVIIGGWKPLGTGWTLTAADTAAFVESSFVPGDNDQCKDRLPRIGTKASCINIYHLVVEGSTDASVLSKAAGKQYHTDKVLN
jgi:SNF2 family DNA or RNA helicase